MENIIKKNNLKLILRFVIYLLGILLTAFGAVLIIRSDLGAGGWDAVNTNLSELFGITIGQASMSINISLLLFLIIYRKNIKFLFVLFPIFTMGLGIDFWDLIVLKNLIPINLLQQILIFGGGFIALPIGLSMIILTGLPAMIFDELTIAFMDITKIDSFFKVRLGIEGTAIILASILGLIAGIGFGAVNIGTLIISAAIGPLISIYINLFKTITGKDKKDVVEIISEQNINIPKA